MTNDPEAAFFGAGIGVFFPSSNCQALTLGQFAGLLFDVGEGRVTVW